jgi:hypothetical protein
MACVSARSSDGRLYRAAPRMARCCINPSEEDEEVECALWRWEVAEALRECLGSQSAKPVRLTARRHRRSHKGGHRDRYHTNSRSMAISRRLIPGCPKRLRRIVGLIRPAVRSCRGHELRVKQGAQHDDNEQPRAQRVPTHRSSSSTVRLRQTDHAAISDGRTTACTQLWAMFAGD